MIAFMIASLILIMIPGPDQALITRHAITRGRTAGLFTMLGGVLGLTVHATAAAFGVSALLLASPTAFTVLKIVGVAYMVWMGVQTIRGSFKRDAEGEGEGNAITRGASHWRFLRRGFLSNALNVKVALFFVTLLPQFLPTSGQVLGQALIFSGIFAIIYLCWFSSYVWAIDWLGDYVRRPKVRAAIERVTGLMLIGFAVRLALFTQS